MATSTGENDYLLDRKDGLLDIGLNTADSHRKIGGDVTHLLDFDGTVYNGDVGQLAAQHEESHLLGFQDIDDFLSKVKERRNQRDSVSRGSEKANIILEESEADIEDIERVLVESQDQSKIKQGFRDLTPSLYERGNMVEIVTAGVDAAAKNLVEDSKVAVTGANLYQSGDEIAAKYCGRSDKPGRIEDSMEEMEDYTPISVGDSATDADFMEDSTKAGGQAIAIEEGAVEFASIDASNDINYETAATLHIILDEIYSTGKPEQARLRAEDFIRDKDYELTEVEPAKNWNAVTLEALSTYQEVKQSYE